MPSRCCRSAFPYNQGHVQARGRALRMHARPEHNAPILYCGYQGSVPPEQANQDCSSPLILQQAALTLSINRRDRFMKTARLVALAVVLLIASKASAQGSIDSYIELFRSDLQTQKKALLTEAMQFTDDEAKVFWPMYREYELEGSKLGDRRIALLKDYAQHYEQLDDKKTEELIQKSFALQKERVNLREKYYKKAVKLMGIKRSARWAQIEQQIENLLEAQISAQIPLLK